MGLVDGPGVCDSQSISMHGEKFWFRKTRHDTQIQAGHGFRRRNGSTDDSSAPCSAEGEACLPPTKACLAKVTGLNSRPCWREGAKEGQDCTKAKVPESGGQGQRTGRGTTCTSDIDIVSYIHTRNCGGERADGGKRDAVGVLQGGTRAVTPALPFCAVLHPATMIVI